MLAIYVQSLGPGDHGRQQIGRGFQRLSLERFVPAQRPPLPAPENYDFYEK